MMMFVMPTDEDYKDGVKSAVALAKMCKDVKFVGAPDKEDDLKNSWGMHPCKDTPAMMMFVMPFLWYFVFYLGLLSYLVFNIWSLKEELAAGPAGDTETGKKPAVAVATATATAAAWAPARLLTRRWPGEASLLENLQSPGGSLQQAARATIVALPGSKYVRWSQRTFFELQQEEDGQFAAAVQLMIARTLSIKLGDARRQTGRRALPASRGRGGAESSGAE